MALKDKSKPARTPLGKVVQETEQLWRRYHLTYVQAIDVAKAVRRRLALERPRERRSVTARLARTEVDRLIKSAYRVGGQHGLLVKTLLLSGARVSEFVALKASDFFLEENMLRIAKGRGGKKRCVPILPELARELAAHLNGRKDGYLFESKRARGYSPRRVQQIIKGLAAEAKITKRVYPHLLRQSIAQYLREGGMTLEQVQRFLGRAKIKTTQFYDESSPKTISEGYRRALS